MRLICYDPVTGKCINRNILECKVFLQFTINPITYCVLIETYWNVKEAVAPEPV